MERREPLYTSRENVNWYSHYGEQFQFSSSVVSNSLHPHGLQYGKPSLSITNSWRLLKIMSIKLVMPSNHLIMCHPLLLLPSIFSSISVFFLKRVSSLHQVAKVLEFQVQHQSFQWIVKTDFL